MKVLLLGAGTSIHLQRWANALVQAGVHLQVATLHTPLPQGWDPHVVLHRLQPFGALGYAAAVPALRRLLRAQAFDLIHVHYATGYGALATLANCRPRLLSVWGSDVDEFPDKSPLHAALVRQVLLSADALAATSQALAQRVQHLLQHQPVPVPVVHITPFGVDTEFFAPRPWRPVSEAAQDLAGPLVIGSSKGLAALYGMDVLLRAFALLPERLPAGLPSNLPAPPTPARELHLRLLATGPQHAELQALSRQLGVQNRVQFVGGLAHADMPAALQALDIFVAPSRRESFGVSVLEASACRVPVVASRVGGLPEVVDDGSTGLLVPSDDAPALANALLLLATDEPRRRAMGAAGRRLVELRYRWADSMATMLALYVELTGKCLAVDEPTGAPARPASP